MTISLTDYRPSENLLAERVILVTGAGAGIGRAAALAYAAHGATVILLGRSVPGLEAVYDEIEGLGYAKPAIFELDLLTAGSEQYEQLAAAIDEEFGVLHGLLHNASILGEHGPLEQANSQPWEAVMQTNVTAPLQLTQALMPLLRAAANASIVFTSSGVGRRARAYWGAYAISKFATEGMMQVFADELENTSEIRVNSLNPGRTRTSMRAAAYPAENPATLPAPEDIMPAYLYLMGDESLQTNGQALDAQ